MKNTFEYLLIICLLICSNQIKAQITLPCFENSIIDAGYVCPSVTDSVWGCDGNCYLNPCQALINSGVTHFTHDPCNQVQQCHADFFVIEFGGVINFIDSGWGASGNTLTYLYDFGDGDTSQNANPTHTYATAGYYLVSLTIDDPGFCTSTSSRYILVNSGSSGSGWNNFYNFINATSLNCTNNGSLTATPYGGTPPYNYLWSNGSIDSSILGLGAGNYSITVTDDSGLVAIGNYNLYSSCNNVLEGNIFNDLNSNCILDGGETPIQNAYVTASDGANSYYGSTDANGYYSINIPSSGNYNISANTSGGYGTCGNLWVCTATGNVFFGTVGDTSTGNNFATMTSSDHDLGIYATWSGANPGFQMHDNLYPYDFSVPSFSGLETITFQYDPQLVYDSSNNAQVAHNLATHTLLM